MLHVHDTNDEADEADAASKQPPAAKSKTSSRMDETKRKAMTRRPSSAPITGTNQGYIKLFTTTDHIKSIFGLICGTFVLKCVIPGLFVLYFFLFNSSY